MLVAFDHILTTRSAPEEALQDPVFRYQFDVVCSAYNFGKGKMNGIEFFHQFMDLTSAKPHLILVSRWPVADLSVKGNRVQLLYVPFTVADLKRALPYETRRIKVLSK